MELVIYYVVIGGAVLGSLGYAITGYLRLRENREDGVSGFTKTFPILQVAFGLIGTALFSVILIVSVINQICG